MGFCLWRCGFNNFVVERHHATGMERGALESVRELPGLFAFAFGAVIAFVAEPIVMCLCILAFSVGTFLLGYAGDMAHLYLPLLLGSIGIHVLMPVRQSLMLALIPEGRRGLVLGLAQSTTAIAQLLAATFVIPTFDHIGFRGVFTWAALVPLLALPLLIPLRHTRSSATRKALTIRHRYWLYYLLSGLDGCRRQVFITFAIFSLVKNHHTDTKTISLLLGISAGINILGKPLIGHLIDRLGDRASLVLGNAIPMLIFLGYGFAPWRDLLFVLYVLDRLCAGLQIARTTYLSRIAPSSEVASSLAFGVSLNHVLAVPLPLIGGWIWTHVSYQATFALGAVVAGVAAVLALWLPRNGEVTQTSEGDRHA